MRYVKYTKDVLEPVVKESKSFAEVIRRLGLRWAGGTQGNIVNRVRLAGLDTSHFLGERRNRGNEHKGGSAKIPWSAVLVLNRSRLGKKEATARLRKAMIDSGIPYVCGTCGMLPEWMGKPLVLQVDHENGDNLDNRPGNVRFGCPNCHSQTETFGTKNRGRVAESADALGLGLSEPQGS